MPDQRYSRYLHFLVNKRDSEEMSDQISDNRIIPKTDVDWAHWNATSVQDEISMGCPFCPCLRRLGEDFDRIPSRSDRNSLFHLDRSIFLNKAGIGSLCLFCQHLDLAHLFGLFNPNSSRRSIWIAFGTLSEVEARSQCDFCHIVKCTIRANTAVYRTTEEPISGDHLIYISFEVRQWFKINVWFDKGPCIYMGVKKILPTHRESIPEVIRIFAASIFRKQGLPPHLDSIPKAARIIGASIFRKNDLPTHLDPIPGTNQVVGKSISWKQVRRWIGLCSKKHKECRPTVTTPSGMRLIDVKNRRVTPELSPRHRHAYVALSYVWGQNIHSRRCVLLKENTKQLERTKSLENLPKTIEDAMTVCKNLGQRFLWVDRLCIVQDDESKKGSQIHAMANIYQAAILTIVAACGDSMESPIPGVGTERQTFQSQARIAGLQVTSALPRLSRTLSGASWSQRAWTYQESALSTRKLYLTDLEVWFTCNKGFQREDISLDDNDAENIWKDDIRVTRLRHGVIVFYDRERAGDILDDYWRHLEEYTKRSLTYQSDVYNAFTGILTVLFGECKTVYGLPELYFDRALLWRLGGDTSTWDIRDCTAAQQRLLYPSWSWSSINGAVRNGKDGDEWRVVPLVPWSLVAEDGSVKTIDAKFQEDRPFHKFMESAWRGGCFEGSSPSGPEKTLGCPTQKKLWDEVRSRGRSDLLAPLTSFNHLRPGMLMTRAQTAVFKLGTCHKNDGFEYFIILNEHGDMAGLVEANELRLKSKAEENQRLESTFHELMALSLSNVSYLLGGERGDDILESLRPKTERMFYIVVKVLLISWDKNTSIARRMSMGWIILREWVEAERTWKTVVLE